MRSRALLVTSGIVDVAVSVYAGLERTDLLAPLIIGPLLTFGLLFLGARNKAFLYAYLILLAVGGVTNLIPPITYLNVIVIVGMGVAGALVIVYLRRTPASRVG